MVTQFAEKYHFQFRLEQLKIESTSLEKMMGFEGDTPEPFPMYIDHIMQLAGSMEGIRGSLFMFRNIKITPRDGDIVLGGTTFHTGKIIASHLKLSSGVAIFVCTAGDTLEQYASKQMKEGNFPEGYIADTAGSLIVETAMDLVQEQFEETLRQQGMGITNRYSPGYCGWNVDEQQKLFSILPPEPCNISLSPSSLMQPIKSVSGIIGFGPGVKPTGYTCQFCEMKECIYRNRLTGRD